jgi:hypothetical protein
MFVVGQNKMTNARTEVSENKSDEGILKTTQKM